MTKINITPLGAKQLPLAPPLKSLLGPSFILLGLGLGSGEVVLWPYMASNYGLGIAWGLLLGITMQFFINMEVSRYALVNGESVFVGFARLYRWLPIWFVFSTFLGFGWPGIGLYGSSLLSAAVEPTLVIQPTAIAIIVFVTIGVILSVGKVLYKTVEQLQKFLIGICVPFIIGLTYYLAPRKDIFALAKGLAGQGVVHGEHYAFFPPEIVFGTFLGALAYAGAGGNLNLAQSCYVRDKGYGMGKYAQGITSLMTNHGTSNRFTLTGNTFPTTPDNISRFQQWWKVINWEHFLVFWLLGLFTMLTLALLAYSTTFGSGDNAKGIDFILMEAAAIGQITFPILGTAFLMVTGVMLCATQLTILDATTRIITENIMLLRSGRSSFHVSTIYYSVLWLQIIFGITVFSLGFNQPLTLIIVGAIINAFSMFVYTGILLYLNNHELAKELRPARWRNFMLAFTFIFFGSFCAVTAYIEFTKF
jgi:hypothetical protein